MIMKKAYLFLGSPLSGKSTKSISLNIPRFSVRHWFEPKRTKGDLPPVGTFLPDNIVFEAAEEFIAQNKESDEIAFDGFPGNAKQFLWLQKLLSGKYIIEIQYCSINKKEAYLRMQRRFVCSTCDGGADPVIPVRGSYCPVCGSKVTKRVDDNNSDFETRWNTYFVREQSIAKAVPAYRDKILEIEITDMRMDLHMHSTVSDGIYTPKELVSLCRNKGIDIFSLTDHDSIDGMESAEQEARENGLDFIPGIELSAIFEGELIHILGYGISKESKKLQSIIQHNKNARIQFDLDVLSCLCNKKIISCDCKDTYHKYEYDKKQGGWKLLNFLIENNICRDGFDYFKILHNINMEFISYTEASKVIEAIQETGICIVAHPGTYGWDEETLHKKLEVLYKMKVDGFECYHPLNKISDRLIIKEFCHQFDMICTGGSDYHGNLSNRSLGYPPFYYHSVKNTKFETLMISRNPE